MADDKKKPSLASVIGAGKDDDEAPPSSMGEDDGDYATSADELFDALKGDDRDAFRSALRACVMSCK